MTKHTHTKKITIISGGQTGVDRAALDAAFATNTACGGWRPEGRRADDGPIDEKYPLKVLKGSGYTMRTRRNVIDSDGTLIIYFNHIYPKAGTEQALLECIAVERPYLLIDAEEVAEQRAAERIAAFVDEHQIRRLNVAGPKARGVPQAYQYTYKVILAYLISSSSPMGLQ